MAGDVNVAYDGAHPLPGAVEPLGIQIRPIRPQRRLAAVSQVVVDLMTGPGCNPTEAEALLSGWRGTKMPGADEILVAARSALLDALIALGDHAEEVTLIGAQAI